MAVKSFVGFAQIFVCHVETPFTFGQHSLNPLFPQDLGSRLSVIKLYPL
jgi:hypothetical protein